MWMLGYKVLGEGRIRVHQDAKGSRSFEVKVDDTTCLGHPSGVVIVTMVPYGYYFTRYLEKYNPG